VIHTAAINCLDHARQCFLRRCLGINIADRRNAVALASRPFDRLAPESTACHKQCKCYPGDPHHFTLSRKSCIGCHAFGTPKACGHAFGEAPKACTQRAVSVGLPSRMRRPSHDAIIMNLMPGNSFGELFRLTTAGVSHGPGYVTIIDGCPPGLPLSVDDLLPDLRRRRPAQSSLVS